VTAPTLYHHFQDKDGLIAALVSAGIDEFLKRKRDIRRNTEDPCKDLRRGWEAWISFAVERPELFQLMVAHSVKHPEAANESHRIMRSFVERMHAQRQLRRGITVDRAALAIQAAANGAIALIQARFSKEEVIATSKLLFEGVLGKLCNTRKAL